MLSAVSPPGEGKLEQMVRHYSHRQKREGQIYTHICLDARTHAFLLYLRQQCALMSFWQGKSVRADVVVISRRSQTQKSEVTFRAEVMLCQDIFSYFHHRTGRSIIASFVDQMPHLCWYMLE